MKDAIEQRHCGSAITTITTGPERISLLVIYEVQGEQVLILDEGSSDILAIRPRVERLPKIQELPV